MSEQIKQISKRIKELREISGISAETLARELGIDSKTYTEYESGNVDIPVSLLFKLPADLTLSFPKSLQAKLQSSIHIVLSERQGCKRGKKKGL